LRARQLTPPQHPDLKAPRVNRFETSLASSSAKRNPVMMIVKNYVAPSEIQGVGVFAGEDIRSGTRIYEFVQGVDLVMTGEQAARFGAEFARFMRIFAYVDPADKTMVISVDNSRFMNHADVPNTAWDQIYGWATRDNRCGEEITCDYYTFWFEPPFADPAK